MPIQEQNIVFVESQVMDDVPEGGGAATGTVIVDGQMNNVFEDISDLDRAYGRFNLRKIFLAVRTLSTDLYGGAKTVVTQLPDDPAIGYALFSTGNPFDTRSDAADHVESYLYKGPTWPGYLLENHIAGMCAINVLQRVGTALPPIGKTLCLVQDEGLATEIEQYVRVTRVAVTETTFEDSQGTFARWVVTLDLSDALRSNFAGHAPNRYDSGYSYTGKTRIRDTTVADAARYCGAQPLSDGAAIGDLSVRAASMFAAIVPSAQTETPLVSQVLAPELTLTLSAGSRSVDVPQQAHTRALAVTPENRRLNWIETLLPIPASGALTLSFRSQNNWYVLQDDGAGALAASDPSIGAGTINYTTGALAVTLGALPDAGSQIMIVWGSPVHYAVRAGATSDAGTDIGCTVTLADTPVKPGSLAVTWYAGGVARTATDTAGTLAGTDLTGSIDYQSGVVRLTFAKLPDRASGLGLTWRQLDSTPEAPAVLAATRTAANGVVTLGGTVSPGSVRLSNVPMRRDGYQAVGPEGGVRVWSDLDFTVNLADGADGMMYQVTSSGVDKSRHYGAIDYSAGTITLAAITSYESTWNGSRWVSFPVPVHVRDGVEFGSAVLSTTGGFAEKTAALTSAEAPITLDLTATIADAIVPNSVRFTLAGKTFEDRAGTLYTDIDPQTGSGTPAGSLDYSTGLATLTYWADGVAAGIAVGACLTRYGYWTATQASFRTAAAPVKPEALSIVAVTADGEQISGSADADGVIAGPWMRGAVNYEFGTAWLEFGQLGDDPDYTGEPPIPQIWLPREVDPSTIRYNAVAYSYLPLDADILGIDAVRLPADGRVPIYRAGDVVLVMHAADTEPATVLTGGTVELGRTRIAWVRVLDTTGATVTSGYTLDRATGIVTFTDITGITMPVTVRHTVADLRMVTDAQISGHLTLARPLTHAYPAGESIVASCLIHGDRRARVSAVWDQATWNGTWTDSLAGSEATATLDTIAHPITVTNEGAETERWLLRWTSTTNVELIGERRGLVYSGPYTADIAPINPRTREPDGSGGVPYLTIPLAANGGGWSAGNVMRINTVGAIADIWIARAIQQSDEPAGDGADGCELYALGNIDRP